MRIDRLEIENFKKYAKQGFDFNPKFTLLVGDNGSGKTTILDALAVASGIWLVRPPDTEVQNSKRPLRKSEIRLVSERVGDRVQFKQMPFAAVTAKGKLADEEGVEWTRLNRGSNTTNESQAKRALKIVESVYARVRQGEKILCPVLAYYGAGRAWLPSNKRWTVTRPKNLNRRWSAFYDCFSERIRFTDLHEWFFRETLASVNRGGQMRPGFEAVKRAVLRCVPEADDLWYDHELRQSGEEAGQIVLSIKGNAQPFNNLSAGQRMMLALIADLAIKAVTQNAFLLPPDKLETGDDLPLVLRNSPGVVLIDELDLHLHPKWQRRVASDLKNTFPSIQFICTSHSPQVIGEVKPEEVRFLEGDGATMPTRTLGIDSDRVLDELMGGSSRNK
jgi:predicted ATP-binding protein involved in virulence